MQSIALWWIRNDLRLEDNPALFKAAQDATLIPLYILEDRLPHEWAIGSAQKWWLHHSLQQLQARFSDMGLDILLMRGDPKLIIQDLVKKYHIDLVTWNQTHVPCEISRDSEIKNDLENNYNIKVNIFDSSLLVNSETLLNKSGEYFKVFTPFWKEARSRLIANGVGDLLRLSAMNLSSNKNLALTQISDHLDEWDLLPKKPNWAKDFGKNWQPGEVGALEALENFLSSRALNSYGANRDIPSMVGTSRLSPYLHFGEISPRYVWHKILQSHVFESHSYDADKYLAELGWREFSYYLLHYNPDLPSKNFNKSFDKFPWQDNQILLQKWQQGNTGYPIIDAGMRELWHSGWMHNRVRMIVASFLVKHLLISWRYGAEWFLDTLLDADIASNSASWQWVAGCGADAAPYFRIFNPILQGQKFDPKGEYVRKWVPELAHVPDDMLHTPWKHNNSFWGYGAKHNDYPAPIIDHERARARAMDAYNILKKQSD
jgi:deoxyribodipyrimidine photo-lyase